MWTRSSYFSPGIPTSTRQTFVGAGARGPGFPTGTVTVADTCGPRALRLWARQRHGNTALHYAAYWGHGGIVQALLAKGADAFAQNAVRSQPSYPPPSLSPAGRAARLTRARCRLRRSCAMQDAETPVGWAQLGGRGAEDVFGASDAKPGAERGAA